MVEDRIAVRFQPGDTIAYASRGDNLLEVALAAGIPVCASCGGGGVCGTCKMVIASGEVATTRMPLISDEEFARGVRQACQSRVMSDLTVEIPATSRLETTLSRQEMACGAPRAETIVSGWRFAPPVSKLYLELTPPTLSENSSDLARLTCALKKAGIENLVVDFSIVKKLSRVLREGKWGVTATLLADGDINRLVNIEASDRRACLLGLAFDIGTTGVRGQLLDLARGTVLAQGLEYNGQISYGEDVISRINYSARPDGLIKLQQAVVKTINSIIDSMIKEAGMERAHIAFMVVAANTTMTQLLLGLDPAYLRLAPYVPTVALAPQVPANTLGIEVGEHVYLYTVPAVAAYVGGDIVAGVLGTGVHQRSGLTLYIDIGTNGEIVVGNSEWMVTASCSAGPAFEGGGIRHGMLATAGAIEGFAIDPTTLEPTLTVIGNVKPKGICGAGLIEIVAGLLRAGVISPKGRFNTELASRHLRTGSDGAEYVLAWGHDSQTGGDIVITEVDIDNLIRAKAAMYAGAMTLLGSVSATPDDIARVIVAGTFGNNIDVEQAIAIGLLQDLPRDRFIFAGNGSLLGARLTAFSTDLVAEGQRLAQLMTSIELSESAAFMDNYVAALFLPHTDASQFPSQQKQTTANTGGKR